MKSDSLPFPVPALAGVALFPHQWRALVPFVVSLLMLHQVLLTSTLFAQITESFSDTSRQYSLGVPAFDPAMGQSNERFMFESGAERQPEGEGFEFEPEFEPEFESESEE